MSDARSELTPAKRAELDRLAIELVRGSVVEFAAARFIAMIVAEVNSRYAAEITRLRAENAALTRERDALREALNEIAAWDDHGGNRGLERDGTYGRFDEPGAVRTARTALKGAPDA